MSDKRDGRPYWARFVEDEGKWKRYGGETQGPSGADLAALRKGAGRPPGTVPSMWRFYTTDVDEEGSFAGGEWIRDAALTAEHHTLVLYAFHQQSRREPAHRPKPPDRPGISIGSAAKRLHLAGQDSQEAVDRRFFAAVTADTVEEVAWHLRGLVRQLKSIRTKSGARVLQPLDYTQLMRDLEAWASPERRDRVRRRWGRDYQAWEASESPEAPEEDDSGPSAGVEEKV